MAASELWVILTYLKNSRIAFPMNPRIMMLLCLCSKNHESLLQRLAVFMCSVMLHRNIIVRSGNSFFFFIISTGWMSEKDECRQSTEVMRFP